MPANAPLELDSGSLSAVVANFYAMDEEIQAEAKRLVQSAGDAMYAIAFALCAVDTGLMRDELTVRITDGGYATSVGWYAEDFDRVGEPFYPPFVEFGTSRMEAQPAITPAYEIVAPQFELDLAALLSVAVARRFG